MMKAKYLFFYLLLVSNMLSAQETTALPKDETGKYIYYEVVNNINSIPTDSLKTRLLSFIAKNKKEIKLKTVTDYVIKAAGKVVIRKSLAMLSHPSGEIKFSFQFEVNADKYRFWLSDFEFIPYHKDRYGIFVPSTTVGQPLETEPKKSNAEQWADYRLQVAKYAIAFAQHLKNELSNKVKPATNTLEKKVISKTW